MSYQSDFWAMGVVFYEMAVGRPPFESTSFSQLVQMIQDDPLHPVKEASPEFNDLLLRLLHKDPAMRLDWAGLKTHAFFNPGDVDNYSIPGQPHFEEYLFRIQNAQQEEGGIGGMGGAWQNVDVKNSKTNVMRLSMNIMKNQNKESDY